MTSAINPNNIDGAYPVAGQDNDSQGFRDNFTNTKTNFEYASAEITDLQNKAVLKSALTGTTLNNNMGGSILSDAQFQDIAETLVALGTQSGTLSLNYVAGPYYTVTTSGSVTLSFSNWPASGAVGRFRFRITVASVAHTLTLPATVSVGTANVQGYEANVITFNKTGTYEFEFESSDGGTTISIFDLNRNFDPVYLPSSNEMAATGAAANLSVTTDYFTTTTAWTGTLAAGAEGQVKVLAMYGDGGDQVITVSNAGWKSSGTGTITFDAIGDACTLQYINSKWFCVGNNGCTFA
jgi:hypothetical protein